MNCAEVDRILASQGADALASKHTRAVDEHLASCGECQDALAAYRRLIAEPVPVTPHRSLVAPHVQLGDPVHERAASRQRLGADGVGHELLVGMPGHDHRPPRQERSGLGDGAPEDAAGETRGPFVGIEDLADDGTDTIGANEGIGVDRG